MTFDLLQGHVIQYGRQTLFQRAKISMLLTISPKILEIFCSFICYLFAVVLFSIIKAKKVTSVPLFDFRIQWNTFQLDS